MREFLNNIKNTSINNIAWLGSGGIGVSGVLDSFNTFADTHFIHISCFVFIIASLYKLGCGIKKMRLKKQFFIVDDIKKNEDMNELDNKTN